MNVAELSQDLLLQLGKDLDPVDILSLLQTCRRIRELRSQRTIWLDALAHIRWRQMQALPLSNAVDLGTLSVQQLEHTVRRATRLNQNLQSETPRPTFTRNFRIESQPWTRIFCIPGAYLAVEHTGGSICCWDILTATRVAKPEIPDLHVLWDPYMELKGKVLIGAYIGGPGPITNLTAVAIDYHDRLDVSISHVLSPDLDGVADRIGMSPTFMNSSVMGWCETLQMGTWSMKTDDAIQIKSLMSSCSAGAFGSCCLPLAGSVYLFDPHSGSFEVKIERLPLPPTTNVDANKPLELHSTTLAIPYPSGSSHFDLIGHAAHLMAPEYGVFAATLKPLTREGRLANIIHFWPAHVNDGTLSFGLGLYHLIQPYELSAVGASGRYVVVWVREGKDYLGLLHLCVTPTPHTTFRKLDTGSLCLSSLSRIALDDSLGLVLVVDDTGRITATSYM